jgi:uncharacterized protein
LAPYLITCFFETQRAGCQTLNDASLYERVLRIVEVRRLSTAGNDEKQSPQLMSLGTPFYEPVWPFYQGAQPGLHLEAWHGRKLSIRPQGSGTRAMARWLLSFNGIDRSGRAVAAHERDTNPRCAAARGDRRRCHCSSWVYAAVRRLLEMPEINLNGLPRADAHVALYPYLTKLVLPVGVGDMAA